MRAIECCYNAKSCLPKMVRVDGLAGGCSSKTWGSASAPPLTATSHFSLDFKMVRSSKTQSSGYWELELKVECLRSMNQENLCTEQRHALIATRNTDGRVSEPKIALLS